MSAEKKTAHERANTHEPDVSPDQGSTDEMVSDAARDVKPDFLDIVSVWRAAAECRARQNDLMTAIALAAEVGHV